MALTAALKDQRAGVLSEGLEQGYLLADKLRALVGHAVIDDVIVVFGVFDRAKISV